MSTANSKTTCPVPWCFSCFKKTDLGGCVAINIAESEYEKPVVSIKKKILLAGNILMRFETELFSH